VKLIRNRRGISPILSNVLLMAIVVAAMSIAITATYVITGNLRETMGERFTIEDVWFRTGQISIYLRNTGKMPITVAAVYVDHVSQPFVPLGLGLGDGGWLNVTSSWSPGGTYYVEVATTRGTQVADYYGAPI